MKMGTPTEIALTMRKCWQVAPTSERIADDILGLPRVLRKVTEAEACVVPD